jgi:DNA-binding transcriptional ArsR family regulator
MLDQVVDRRVVQALGHPTRVQVLRILDRRAMASPVQLSDELSIPLGTMGYHVRRLEVLGMIELADTRQRRGAIEHFYRTADQRDETVERLETAVRAKTWDELDAAMQEVEAAARRGAFDGADAQLVQRIIRLDSTGRTALEEACAELSNRVEQIQAECAARMSAQPAGRIREINLVTMDFDIADPSRSSAHLSLVK